VVKDLFKLRKYNIHEVNKQIIQSQSNLNSAGQEDEKANDPSTEKTNDNSQDIPIETDVSQSGDKVLHDTVVQDKVVHDTVVQDKVVHDSTVQDKVVHDPVVHDIVIQDTVVQDRGTANPNILTKESQK